MKMRVTKFKILSFKILARIKVITTLKVAPARIVN